MRYRETASIPSVKLIELKLSQGAKPGKGGILPAKKVTEEIARIRGIPVATSALSPACHTAFDNPVGLMEFIQELREGADGKPVGIKFCLGRRREFFAICRPCVRPGLPPTLCRWMAPRRHRRSTAEFSNSVGTPLVEELVTVHNAWLASGFEKR